MLMLSDTAGLAELLMVVEISYNQNALHEDITVELPHPVIVGEQNN